MKRQPMARHLALTALLVAAPALAQSPKLVLPSAFHDWTANNPRLSADVNGDGKTDIVGFANDGTYVALSTGTGFNAPKLWQAAYGASVPSGGWTAGIHPRTAVDVNKDGKADIIGFGGDNVYVSLSTGSGFQSPAVWLAGMTNAQGWATEDRFPRTAADVNGDGRADLVGFASDGVYVALAKPDATGFATPVKWNPSFGLDASWGTYNAVPRGVADVNGDGKADVVGFATDGVYVALSNGAGFQTQAKWISNFGASAGGWGSQDGVPRTTADVNGDGKADVVGFATDGVYVSLSTGAGFSQMQKWAAAFGASCGMSWPSQANYPRVAADFTGDGKADLIGFASDGVRASASDGTAFLLPRAWEQPLSAADATYINAILTELNRQRSLGVKADAYKKCSSGPLPPLKWNRGLEAAAYRHSFDMLNSGQFTTMLASQQKNPHLGSDGSNYTDRISASGCKPAGEVVNFTFGGKVLTAAEAILLWMEMSPDHCSVIFSTTGDSVGFSMTKKARTATRPDGSTYQDTNTFLTLDVGSGCATPSTPLP